MDVFGTKPHKKYLVVLRAIVLALVIISSIYICSICVKQEGVIISPNVMRVQVTEEPCRYPSIPPSELPYIHYPKPMTYSRDECACTPVRYFAIISMQRSGSGWFETLLNSHINISSNGEIFSVKERRSNISAMGLMQNPENIVEYFKKRGISAIFLFRKHLLRRWISVLANNHDRNAKQLNGTHKAHVHSRHEADVLARYKPTIDVPTLIQDMKHTSKLIEDALQHFNGTRHILLYYEEIIRTQTRVFDVLDFLRMPHRKLESLHVKIHTRPLPEQIENWDVVSESLKETEYQTFLQNDYG